MPVNLDKPHLWKTDVAESVDMYNRWFMEFAPAAFRKTRTTAIKHVRDTLRATAYLTNIQPALLRQHPEVLPTLRMSTCPPLAVDRLIGLAGVSPNLVHCMEKNQRLPARMPNAVADRELAQLGAVITQMADPDIFVWLQQEGRVTPAAAHRAATVVADRLCGAMANPIVRNAQEQRQLAKIQAYLEKRGYRQIHASPEIRFDSMPPGTFSFRMNVPVKQASGVQSINIPVDAVIMPKTARPGDLPLFLEAKSAGDFTNTNKRRKEEAAKMTQLRHTYGADVRFNLFLCGYFDSGYLGYEATEGIDWVWEHRIDDLSLFGI